MKDILLSIAATILILGLLRWLGFDALNWVDTGMDLVVEAIQWVVRTAQRLVGAAP